MICLSNLSIDPLLYIHLNGSDLSAAQACCNSLLGHAILSLPQYVIMYFIHVHSYIHLYLCIYICTICTGILSSWPATTSASQDNGSVQRQDESSPYDDCVVDSFLTVNSMQSAFISISWISSRAAHSYRLCTMYTAHMVIVYMVCMCPWCITVFIR